MVIFTEKIGRTGATLSGPAAKELLKQSVTVPLLVAVTAGSVRLTLQPVSGAAAGSGALTVSRLTGIPTIDPTAPDTVQLNLVAEVRVLGQSGRLTTIEVPVRTTPAVQRRLLKEAGGLAAIRGKPVTIGTGATTITLLPVTGTLEPASTRRGAVAPDVGIPDSDSHAYAVARKIPPAECNYRPSDAYDAQTSEAYRSSPYSRHTDSTHGAASPAPFGSRSRTW